MTTSCPIGAYDLSICMYASRAAFCATERVRAISQTQVRRVRVRVLGRLLPGEYSHARGTRALGQPRAHFHYHVYHSSYKY